MSLNKCLSRGLERATQRREADKEVEMALGDPEPLEEPENAVRKCGWCGHEDLCKPGEPASDSPHHRLCCLDQYSPVCRTYKRAKPLTWRDRDNFF